MVNINDIRTAAGAEAGAHSFNGIPLPPTGLLSAGRDLTTELVIAHTLEQLDKTGWGVTAWQNRTLNSDATTAFGAQYTSAQNVRNTAKMMVPGLNSVLAGFNTRLAANPLKASEVTDVETALTAFISFNTSNIRNDRTLILMVATIKHTLAQKNVDRPGNPGPGLNPPIGHLPITGPTINITGVKSYASNTIELIDSVGNVIASDPGVAGPAFHMDNLQDISSLKKGQNYLTLRTKNPTTNVIHDISYVLNLNLPVNPEAPENMSKDITTAPGTRGRVSGRLKVGTHDVILRTANGALINPADYTVIHPAGSHHFQIELPDRLQGTHEFQVVVQNAGCPEHIEMIKLNVTNPVAQPIGPVNMGADPIMGGIDHVHFGDHHVHIDHTNPVPGSTIKIEGQGLANPITVSVPTIHVAGTPLHIDLPDFDTSKAGRKNMKITTTDPHNATVTRTDLFDINVDRDPHLVEDHRTLSKPYFLSCTNHTGYQIHGDERLAVPVPPPLPPRLSPPHYNPNLRTYTIGRNGGMIGWWAEVPYLPGEKPFLRERKKIRALTKNALYDKIQLYLRELNVRAHVMNNSDHAHDTPHDPAHPETPAVTPAAPAEGTHAAEHPAEAHAAPDGSFYDRSVEKVFGHGWIGKGLTGFKNLWPKKIREIAGGTVASVKNGALAGGLVWGVGALAGSAFIASFAPAAAVATFGYYAYQRMRYGRKGKEEGGGEAAAPAGHA